MKHLILAPALILMAACATGPEPYQQASSPTARGYAVLPIENDRLRVSYRAKDGETSRQYALLTAAEATLERGADWFRVTNAYTDEEFERGRGGGSSVSIGGSTGSRGRSSVGVGVGIGFPIGGGSSGGETVHGLEIIIGSGPQPDDPEVYDAAEVRDALLGVPAG